jgi:hypothetical protein
MLDGVLSLLGVRRGPAANWPALAAELKLAYEPLPMLRADWNGRQVTVQLGQENSEVLISAMLAKPTRLRLEIAPKAVVATRAGEQIPDAVDTSDEAFSQRLFTRCSDRAAGLKLMSAGLRRRLLERPAVDILAENGTIVWKLPAADDAETLKTAFDILTSLAQELEAYPA